MTFLEGIFLIIGVFLVCALAVRALSWLWPHVPLLPGLFEDMANGYSYDENGNRIDG